MSQIEWEAVERFEFSDRARSRWRTAVRPEARRPARHHAKFIQNELDVEWEKVTLLHQQGSQQTELLSTVTYTRRPRTLKIDISKYKGVDEDSLLRWFVELDDAIRAIHIIDEEMQTAFAQ